MSARVGKATACWHAILVRAWRRRFDKSLGFCYSRKRGYLAGPRSVPVVLGPPSRAWLWPTGRQMDLEHLRFEVEAQGDT